ncbi:UNVERIFIED_CONTAM: hypothetical protein Scaly_0186500 [Sesamum calycinum]|uniref:Mitochondrial carrier protein n=1 Tax=Sesamum calycinum TaxID=2727403 RepID=A0AAW2T0Q6_9LAMI
MQVAGSGLSQMTGLSVFRHIIRRDGIPGIFRGFGTSAIGSLPGRVLALTSLEVSKDMTLKYTEGLNVPDATRIGIANGVAGMVSNLVSCVYFVPLDVEQLALRKAKHDKPSCCRKPPLCALLVKWSSIAKVIVHVICAICMMIRRLRLTSRLALELHSSASHSIGFLVRDVMYKIW